MLSYYYATLDVFDKESFFSDALRKVDKKRQEKVLRCKNELDKKRSLLAGLLLRYGLENMGYSFDELEFSVTSEGKPYIKMDESLHFNISHAGEYVGCILSSDSVGLDMESLGKSVFLPEKEHKLEKMAKKCLSDVEWSHFCRSLEKEKAFLEYWTKKEAYSKCFGKGLGMDFSHIDTEQDDKKFWNTWITDEYHVSVFRMSEVYDELTIHRVKFE